MWVQAVGPALGEGLRECAETLRSLDSTQTG